MNNTASNGSTINPILITFYFFLKLESEIRVRENRDAKLLLDTQEVVLSREREKELRTQISRLQNELERDRAKAKTLQDKVCTYNIETACEKN